jgi:hypothetical protein
MIFNIFIGLIMASAFVGMILCAKKQHVNAVAKPAAIGLLVVVVICAIMILVHNTSEGDTASLINNEMVYAKSSTYMLGKKVAELNPGAKVLYIVDAINEKNRRQQAMIEGFKEGCGSAISDIKVIAPKLKKTEDSSGMMSGEMNIMELVKAKDFNKMISKNKAYKVICSTIGLPYDAADLQLFKDFDKNPKKCPKLALIGGDTSKMAPLVQAGLLEALVVYSPDAKYTDDDAPDELKDAFDMRYILVTKDNLEKIKKKYPGRIFAK